MWAQLAQAGFAGAGGLLGALGAEQSGKSQAKAYREQAGVIQAEAANRAAQEKRKYRDIASAQRAAYGASGVDVNAGSAVDVVADTDAEGLASAMQIFYSGEMDAYNARRAAAMAEANARFGVLGSLLGGGASAFNYGVKAYEDRRRGQDTR